MARETKNIRVLGGGRHTGENGERTQNRHDALWRERESGAEVVVVVRWRREERENGWRDQKTTKREEREREEKSVGTRNERSLTKQWR